VKFEPKLTFIGEIMNSLDWLRKPMLYPLSYGSFVPNPTPRAFHTVPQTLPNGHA
jgi:hypothetical protein